MKQHNKIKFIAKQLALTSSKKIFYFVDTLIWACACKIYYSSPSSCKIIRESNTFTLPLPRYNKKLTVTLVTSEIEISRITDDVYERNM